MRKCYEMPRYATAREVKQVTVAGNVLCSWADFDLNAIIEDPADT